MTSTTSRTFSEAATTNVTAETDVLPQWNFEKFYTSAESPEFEADFVRLEQWTEDFRQRYEGKVATLDGDGLAAMIAESKDKDDLQGKLSTYVSLKQVQDSELYTDAAEATDNRMAPINAADAFQSYEMKKIDEQQLQQMLAQSAALRVYAPYIDQVRKGIPHTPPLEVIKYRTEASPASGVVGLYDKWHAAKRYEFEGKQLNQTQILDIFTNSPDKARRAAAHAAFIGGLKEDSMLMAHLYNERLRLKTVDDKWSKFDQPWDGMNLGNNVTAAMVDALEQSVKDNYKPVLQRFYALKAKLLGQDHLDIFDRNVNPFDVISGKQEEDYVPYNEAKEIVLKAYRSFSPRMADAIGQFFDNGWIDAVITPNKAPGAFAHPGAARLANPMVMLNYKGSARDVATMAHELGHGAHQFLSAHKGDSIVHSPLTYAETASVFGEMLTFKSLVAAAKNDDERRNLLCEKINDMVNTVFRQISFHDFEKRIHTAFREEGRPLTKEELSGHFVEALRESYGPTIPLEDDYGIAYTYIGHFMHSPFYVYAYAFGDSLVNALYQVYEEGTVPDFEDKYIEMLEKGGTLEPKDLKDMFGLDVTDPGFWNKGIKVISDLLDELETLCQPLLDQKAKPGNPGPAPQA